MKIPRWTKEEEQSVRTWLESGEKPEDVKRRLKKEYGADRTVKAITLKHDKLIKHEEPSARLPIVSAQSSSDQKLINKLYERENNTYNMMRVSANLIREYDKFGKYRDVKVGETDKLSDEERKIVVGIIQHKIGEKGVGNLNLLALFSKADNGLLHIVAPMFNEDLGDHARETFASCLDGVVIGVFANNGYDCSGRKSFRDLVKYTLKGPSLNKQKTEKDLTDEVRKKYPSTGSILLYVQDSALYPSLR